MFFFKGLYTGSLKGSFEGTNTYCSIPRSSKIPELRNVHLHYSRITSRY